jgi:hypothetical protein
MRGKDAGGAASASRDPSGGSTDGHWEVQRALRRRVGEPTEVGTVIFSHNKPAPAISHQPNEHAVCPGHTDKSFPLSGANMLATAC